jgi:hypothetical protein
MSVDRLSSGDRPDALELVEAVGAWLAGELAPALEPGPRFQAMVAAQGLAMAARELQLADEHAALDRASLAPLVPSRSRSDPAEVRRALAAAIRGGEHDERLDELLTVLREHVRRKLAIARPGYGR